MTKCYRMECFKTVDGVMLAANGVIYFNRFVKKDRQLATERMVSILKQGGNIMFFPEGVWNFTQNLSILLMNWGIIRVAKMGGAEIIPMAVEQYGKRFEICVGENFFVDNYGEDDEEIKRATTDLRDVLATLKYSIWSQEKMLSRTKATKSYWNRCTDAWIDGFPVTEEEVRKMEFRPKDIVTREEAFKSIERIIQKEFYGSQSYSSFGKL